MSSRLPATDLSERQAALTAGVTYLVIALLGFFASFFVLQRLVEPGDAAATVANITGSEGLFRGGIAGFVLLAVADTVVAWALYVFLRRASQHLALLAAWFQVAYAAILGAVTLNLLLLVQFLGGESAALLEPAQRDAQAMLYLDTFSNGWIIALVLFGVHLLLLAAVIFRSDYVPSFLGVLLALAGAGYVVDGFANVLLSNYGDYEDLFPGCCCAAAGGNPSARSPRWPREPDGRVATTPSHHSVSMLRYM
jgi:hypothetical protein